MRKILGLLCAAALLLAAVTACAGGQPSDKKEYLTVSRLARSESGKTYLEVDGQPFLYTGVQMRVDGFMNCEGQTADDMEKYIKVAAELNVNCVQVPVDWRDIEPEKDVFTFRDLGKILGFAKKYGVKVELLWFSTNMCGDSHSYHIPDYIWNDEETYPKYRTNHKGSFWNYYGYQGMLVLSHPELLARETNAVGRMMDFLYDWERDNGGSHVVIGVQVHNEPDGFPRWRLSQQEVMLPDGSRRLTDREAWDDVCAALDAVGRAVKDSRYRVITRVNLTVLQDPASNWEAFAPRIAKLSGIDMVGNDPYTTSLRANRDMLLALGGEEFDGNFPHIAENKGSYGNVPSLILGGIASGGGYLIYDLATPKFFIDNTSDPANIDHGILTAFDYENPQAATNLADKPHTQLTRDLLAGMKAAGRELVLADPRDVAAFNLKQDYPREKVEGDTLLTRRASVTFRTQTGALGFAVVRNGYATVFATSDAEVTFGGCTPTDAQIGSYEADGSWASSANAQLTGSTLALSGGKVYRVALSDCTDMESDTLDWIG